MTFIPPPIEVGDIVLWYPGGSPSAEPSAAIVTRLGHSALNLGIFVRDNAIVVPRDGVRHLSDPLIRKAEVYESGGWDYTPKHKEFLRLQAILNELTAPAKKKVG